MSDPIYRKEVLRLAADAVAAGRLPEPRATGTAHNPSCGDKAVIDLAVTDGRVTGVAQDTKACVLSQASASILGGAMTGTTEIQIRTLLGQVKAMLDGGKAPEGSFAAYAVFDGLAGFKNRHRCVTLPIEAALAAFENSEASEKDGKGSKT